MKYNQPYGLSDETTLYSVPYINGNPSTGTMGSIPPAASIEHDQREIVAVIQWAYDHGYHDYAAQLCQAPSSGDLTQLLKAIYGIANSRFLTAPRDYYVNAVTGVDTNDGLAADRPFKTLQAAQNALVKFNLNGFNVTVHVAPGTYAQLSCGSIGGTGTIQYVGDTSNPANCLIAPALGAAVIVAGTGDYRFTGFKVTCAANAVGVSASGFYVWGTGGIQLGAIDFGACLDAHVTAVNGGYVGCFGPFRITGNTAAHYVTGSGGRILNTTYAPALLFLTITTPVSINYFVTLATGTMVMKYGGITNFGFVSGTKYLVVQNGIVDSAGGGVNYLPGNVAGITGSGGQYT